MNHVVGLERTGGRVMSGRQHYYSPEEDWDVGTLQMVNSQLERYLKMLPDGTSDVSLEELQSLALRQQQQVANQERSLVAKQQRLRYLQEQEAQQEAQSSEQEELLRLRNRYKAQEMKLKHLRLQQCQLSEHDNVIKDLASELNTVKRMFNEKEKELAMAVAKVEKLTQELETLRQSQLLDDNNLSATSVEFKKVHRECLQQRQMTEQRRREIDAHLVEQQEKLRFYKEQMNCITRNVAEIRQEVKKLKQPKVPSQAPRNLNDVHQTMGPTEVIMGHMAKDNATVSKDDKFSVTGFNKPDRKFQSLYPSGTTEVTLEHISQPSVPKDNNSVSKDDIFSATGFNKQDPKYQSLPSKAQFISGEKVPGDQPHVDPGLTNVKTVSSSDGPPALRPVAKPVPFKDSLIPNTGFSKQDPKYQSLPNKGHENLEKVPYNPVPVVTTTGAKPVPQVPVQQSMPASTLTPGQPGWVKAAALRSGGVSNVSNMTPRPFGTTYATSGNRGPSAVQTPMINISEEERQMGSGQSSPASSDSSQASQGRSSRSLPPALTPRMGDTVTLVQESKANGFPFVNKTGDVGRMGSDDGRGTNHLKPGNGVTPSAVDLGKNLDGQVATSPVGQDNVDGKVESPKQDLRSPIATSTPITPGTGGILGSNFLSAGTRPLPTIRYAPKSVIASTYMGGMNRVQPVPQLEAKGPDDSGSSGAGPSSSTEPFSPLRKFRGNFDLVNMNTGGPSDGASGGKSQPDSLGSRDNTEDNTSLEEKTAFTQGSVDKLDGHPSYRRLVQAPLLHPSITSDKVSYKQNTPKHIRRRHSESEEDLGGFLQRRHNSQGEEDLAKFVHGAHQLSGSGEDNPQVSSSEMPSVDPPAPSTSTHGHTPLSAPKSPPGASSSPGETPGTKKKSILKGKNSVKNPNRMRFDPLTLLLDASLEGELDLVMHYAKEVENVSASNDEGITALHNAICANNYEVVKFLVEFGADVNSPDTDGWTPLHCASSCGKIRMVQLLVEHGACIFATTQSDKETAADKWEEMNSSSDYLYSIQEKLGIINNGEVYALYDYEAKKEDELTFCTGDKMTVLRKGDETEKEWWWARLGDREGYIPRNFLGISPRVKPSEI